MLLRLTVLLALLSTACATVPETDDAGFATTEGALTAVQPIAFGQAKGGIVPNKSTPAVWTFQAGSSGKFHVEVHSALPTTPFSVSVTRQSGKGWLSVAKQAGVGEVQFDAQATTAMSMYRLTVATIYNGTVVQVALTCASGICTPPPSSCDIKLFANVQPLLPGLLYPSESDRPFETVAFPSTGKGAMPTSAELLPFLGLPANTPVEVVQLGLWFTPLLQTADSLTYGKLRGVLAAGLTGLTVLRVGTIEVQVFVLGRTACGTVAGVRTVAIET